MVYLENGPFDDAMGRNGGRPLDDTMINWTPWKRDGKLEVAMGPLDDAMMNWDPFITWWEIRGHHFDDMMRKLGALGGAIEDLGPFALWWRNFPHASAFDDAMGKLETLNKQWGTAGDKWPDVENGKLGPWWRNGGLWWCNGQIKTLAMMKLGTPDDLMGKLGALDHYFVFQTVLYISIALFQTYGSQILIE